MLSVCKALSSTSGQKKKKKVELELAYRVERQLPEGEDIIVGQRIQNFRDIKVLRYTALYVWHI